MKNGYKYSLIAVSMAVLVLSCQKNPELKAPEENPNLVTLTCEFPAIIDENGTKVSLGVDGKTGWEVGDKIVIYGNPSSSDDTKRVVHEIAAGDIVNPEVAVFDVNFSGLEAQDDSGTEGTYYPYTVAYPYTDGQPYYLSTGNNNCGRSCFQNTNQILMAGHVSDDKSSIILNQINAAITFSVSGDFDSYTFSGRNGTEIVGYSTFVVEMNRRALGEGQYRQKYKNGGTVGPLTSIEGSVNGNGTAVNYIFLPANAQKSGTEAPYTYDIDSQRYANVVYLPNGFTIKLLKGGVIKKYITSTAPLTIRPGHMINLGELPAAKIYDYEAIPASEKASAMELSNPKSANCYVVDGGDDANKDKVFKFPAVKGNTYVSGGAAGTSVGEVVSVDIVWETWNNAESVTANSVIKVVDYKDGFVYFKMPSTLHAGNALIAVKDADGNILWSWHIWVPETSIDLIDNSDFFGKQVMDRNLGALDKATISAAGRKTYGMYYQWGRNIPLPGLVNSTATFTAVTGPKSTAYAIANPTAIIHVTENDTNGNWNEENLEYLWEDSDHKKEIYDPCPPGYKVPSYDSSTGLWVEANTGWTYTWAANNYSYGNIVFPMAGWYSSGTSVSYEGERSIILSATAHSNPRAKLKIIRQDKSGWYYGNYFKQEAASVRCVAE